MNVHAIRISITLHVSTLSLSLSLSVLTLKILKGSVNDLLFDLRLYSSSAHQIPSSLPVGRLTFALRKT